MYDPGVGRSRYAEKTPSHPDSSRKNYNSTPRFGVESSKREEHFQ